MCSDVQYNMEANHEAMLTMFDDDETLVMEFQIAFADIEADVERLMEDFNCDEGYPVFTEEVLGMRERDYDDLTVNMFGGEVQIVGYDEEEGDFFRLDQFDEEAAIRGVEERLGKKTKLELIRLMRQASLKAYRFLDLQMRFNSLRDVIDVLRGDTARIAATLKEIDELWAKAQENGWSKHATKFDYLLSTLPERVWIE